MSWRATAYVKGVKSGAKGEPITRSEKLVMFVLADSYNDDQGYAWPSIPRLAESSLLSQRQVRYCLRALEEKGLVETLPGTGRGHTNRYVFPGLSQKKEATVAGFAAEKGAIVAAFPRQKGAVSRTERRQFQAGKGATAIAAEPQENPQLEPPIEQEPARALFQTWNAHCGSLPKALALTPDRSKKCRACLELPNFAESFRRAVGIAARTPFLLGRTERGWKATFDWMIANDSNVFKVLEGKYGEPIPTESVGVGKRQNGQRDIEQEWKHWLEWADARSLDQLRKQLNFDLNGYPEWAQTRVADYLRDREVREGCSAASR